MGELDKKYSPYSDHSISWSEAGINDSVSGSGQSQLSWQEIISGDPSVTSRNDIINPYALINIRNYPNTVKGRRQYEADLARAVEFQKQQLASYEEFFNSPEQAAIRERVAGLNPDLVGLDNAGSAADTSSAESVPGSTLPTTGEQIFNAVSAFSSMVSALNGVTSLVSFPDQLASLRAGTFGQKLINTGLGPANNIAELQELALVSATIDDFLSSGLAVAQQKHLDSGSAANFDSEAWLTDEARFGEWSLPYGGSDSYQSLFRLRQQRALQLRKQASDLQFDFASSSLDFAKIYNSPLYSADQKIMFAQVGPYMAAQQAADEAEIAFRQAYAEYNSALEKAKNPESAAEAINSQNKYTADYYSNLQGKVVAAFENYSRVVEQNALTIRNSINSHYKMLIGDNPASEEGMKAAYLFSADGAVSWSDYYYANNANKFTKMVESDAQLKALLVPNQRYTNLQKLINIVTFPIQMNMEAASNVLGFLK